MPKDRTPGHPGIQRIRDELQRLRAQHLYRTRRVLESPAKEGWPKPEKGKK